MGNIFQDFFRHSKEVQDNFYAINNYMEKKGISSSLKLKIKEYLSYYWDEEKDNLTEKEQKIVGQLSESLRQQLKIEANKIVLTDTPVFHDNFSKLLNEKICSIIREQRFHPEQIITKYNEEDDCSIYFIQKGKVEVFSSESQIQGIQQRSYMTLERGQYFGTYSFFTGMPRNVSVRSTDFSQLLVIKRQDFIDILGQYDEDYQMFCMIKDQLIFDQSNSRIQQRCSICGKFEHIFKQCPVVHYVPLKTKVIKKYNFSQVRYTRQKINRNQKKYTLFSTFSQSKTYKLLGFCLRFSTLKELEFTTKEGLRYLEQNESFLLDQEWIDSFDDITSESESESESEPSNITSSALQDKKEQDLITKSSNKFKFDNIEEISNSTFPITSHRELPIQEIPMVKLIHNPKKENTHQDLSKDVLQGSFHKELTFSESWHQLEQTNQGEQNPPIKSGQERHKKTSIGNKCDLEEIMGEGEKGASEKGDQQNYNLGSSFKLKQSRNGNGKIQKMSSFSFIKAEEENGQGKKDKSDFQKIESRLNLEMNLRETDSQNLDAFDFEQNESIDLIQEQLTQNLNDSGMLNENKLVENKVDLRAFEGFEALNKETYPTSTCSSIKENDDGSKSKFKQRKSKKKSNTYVSFKNNGIQDDEKNEFQYRNKESIDSELEADRKASHFIKSSLKKVQCLERSQEKKLSYKYERSQKRENSGVHFMKKSDKRPDKESQFSYQTSEGSPIQISNADIMQVRARGSRNLKRSLTVMPNEDLQNEEVSPDEVFMQERALKKEKFLKHLQKHGKLLASTDLASPMVGRAQKRLEQIHTAQNPPDTSSLRLTITNQIISNNNNNIPSPNMNKAGSGNNNHRSSFSSNIPFLPMGSIGLNNYLPLNSETLQKFSSFDGRQGHESVSGISRQSLFHNRYSLANNNVHFGSNELALHSKKSRVYQTGNITGRSHETGGDIQEAIGLILQTVQQLVNQKGGQDDQYQFNQNSIQRRDSISYDRTKSNIFKGRDQFSRKSFRWEEKVMKALSEYEIVESAVIDSLKSYQVFYPHHNLAVISTKLNKISTENLKLLKKGKVKKGKGNMFLSEQFKRKLLFKPNMKLESQQTRIGKKMNQSEEESDSVNKNRNVQIKIQDDFIEQISNFIQAPQSSNAQTERESMSQDQPSSPNLLLHKQAALPKFSQFKRTK